MKFHLWRQSEWTGWCIEFDTMTACSNNRFGIQPWINGTAVNFRLTHFGLMIMLRGDLFDFREYFSEFIEWYYMGRVEFHEKFDLLIWRSLRLFVPLWNINLSNEFALKYNKKGGTQVLYSRPYHILGCRIRGRGIFNLTTHCLWSFYHLMSAI